MLESGNIEMDVNKNRTIDIFTGNMFAPAKLIITNVKYAEGYPGLQGKAQVGVQQDKLCNLLHTKYQE